MTHHALTQKKELYAFRGLCECGKFSRVVMGRDLTAQADLREMYLLHVKVAKAEARAEAALRAALRAALA